MYGSLPLTDIYFFLLELELSESIGMAACKNTPERDNPYYFFRANQQQEGTKIYLLTPSISSLSVNE